MLMGDDLVDVITVFRLEVNRLPQADRAAGDFRRPAAIAIGNVQLFEEIRDKSRQFDPASQHKPQFLARISHEPTPLNAIIGLTAMLVTNTARVRYREGGQAAQLALRFDRGLAL